LAYLARLGIEFCHDVGKQSKGNIGRICVGMKNSESQPNKTERAPIYWMHEAIEYIGLDRLGLARPDKAMYRLVDKGALHPKKIAGHFVFNKKELDTLITNGDQKRGRGRPRKF
jgi:hypothetical protein